MAKALCASVPLAMALVAAVVVPFVLARGGFDFRGWPSPLGSPVVRQPIALVHPRAAFDRQAGSRSARLSLAAALTLEERHGGGAPALQPVATGATASMPTVSSRPARRSDRPRAPRPAAGPVPVPAAPAPVPAPQPVSQLAQEAPPSDVAASTPVPAGVQVVVHLRALSPSDGGAQRYVPDPAPSAAALDPAQAPETPGPGVHDQRGPGAGVSGVHDQPGPADGVARIPVGADGHAGR